MAKDEGAGRRLTKGVKTRRRILEAAAAAFNDNGYARTTLKDIADAVDMQVASLYHHFSSKEELVDEVLNMGRHAIEAAAAEAVLSMGANASPLTKLRAAIAAHVHTTIASGEFASANLRILSQVPKDVRERHQKLQRNYADFWESLLEEGRNSGQLRADLDPTAVRLLLLGAMNWTVEWYRPGRLTFVEIAAVCSEMFLSGLEVRSSDAAAQRQKKPKTS